MEFDFSNLKIQLVSVTINNRISTSENMTHMNGVTSFPKNKINVLLLENIHPIAKELFEKETFQVSF